MSNEIALHEGIATEVAPLPAHMQEYFGAAGDFNDDLSDGVTGGFGVLSIRAGMFRVKYQGDEDVVRQDQNDPDSDPVRSMEVVLLKASPYLSKIYYKDAYEEGNDNAPDCFSMDGKKPDASAQDPQCETCTKCPHNVWGSKITPAGKKTKACTDARRIAIAPAGDIPNEIYGGPMLLRVPAASLADLATYGKTQRQNGRRYDALVTRLTFDTEASFPKLKFAAKRYLKTNELAQVYEHVQGDTIRRILEEASDMAPPAPKRAETQAQAQAQAASDAAGDLDDGLDAEASAPAPARTTKKKRTKKAVQAAPKAQADDLESAPAAAAPAAAGSNGQTGGFGEELDGILDDLDGLE